MTQYTVVKIHLSGPLVGMKTGETTQVHIPEGTYTCCVTRHKYRVVYCAEDLVVDAADQAADDVYDNAAAFEPCDTYHVAYLAAYHTAVNHGAGPRTAATIALAAAEGYPL